MPERKRICVFQYHSPSSKNLMPLAAASIVAYAKADIFLARECEFRIQVQRVAPDDAAAVYGSLDVAAFSTYLWNFRLSMAVARNLKESNPRLLVVVGGPMISMDYSQTDMQEFFQQHPYVDAAVHGMGEYAFARLLKFWLNERSWRDVSGVTSIDRRDGKNEVVFSGKPQYPETLDDLPSPFLDGTLDSVLARDGTTITGALWETNRGCCYTCAYCWQGGGDCRKIWPFPWQRLAAELRWMADHRVEYVAATDANFGILERDAQIIDELARLKRETGYPRIFLVNWTKNTSERVVWIAKKLIDAGITTRVTLSRQSFNPDTLKAILRKNISLDSYDRLKRESLAGGFPVYGELILGLPEETYKSFAEGLAQAMDPSVMHMFVFYLCRLLPGTLLNTSECREKYALQTRTCSVAIERQEGRAAFVDETEEIVVATGTLPLPDWYRAHVLGCLAMGLYNYRLAFFVLNYLRDRHGVALTSFLEHLAAAAADSPDYPVLAAALQKAEECRQGIMDGGSSLVSCEYTGDVLYQGHEALFILMYHSYNDLLGELGRLVRAFLGGALDVGEELLLEEVFRYQKALIPSWNGIPEKAVAFDYSIPQYFDGLCRGVGVASLEHSPTVLRLRPINAPPDEGFPSSLRPIFDTLKNDVFGL